MRLCAAGLSFAVVAFGAPWAHSLCPCAVRRTSGPSGPRDRAQRALAHRVHRRHDKEGCEVGRSSSCGISDPASPGAAGARAGAPVPLAHEGLGGPPSRLGRDRPKPSAVLRACPGAASFLAAPLRRRSPGLFAHSASPVAPGPLPLRGSAPARRARPPLRGPGPAPSARACACRGRAPRLPPRLSRSAACAPLRGSAGTRWPRCALGAALLRCGLPPRCFGRPCCARPCPCASRGPAGSPPARPFGLRARRAPAPGALAARGAAFCGPGPRGFLAGCARLLARACPRCAGARLGCCASCAAVVGRASPLPPPRPGRPRWGLPGSAWPPALGAPAPGPCGPPPAGLAWA